jgi:MFS transporter, SP family, general alpha glucoside:H+ symporter
MLLSASEQQLETRRSSGRTRNPKIALGFVGIMCSWFVMRHAGRRTLYIPMGSWDYVYRPGSRWLHGHSIESSRGLGLGFGTLLLIFVFTYDLTVGPVCYGLVAEIPSTRFRIKSVVLARNCYIVASVVANFLNPPILNSSAWNLRGKGGLIWCAFCFLSLVWTFFRLPERVSAPEKLTFCSSGELTLAAFQRLRLIHSALQI